MRFSLVPFEERILLDAAGAANVVNVYEAEHASDQAQQRAQQQAQQADNPGAVSGNNDAVDGRILVVSSEIHDSALLADAAKNGVTVITFDFNTSLADLAQSIADKTAGIEISSIGFAVLGTEGAFSITSDTLVSVASLDSNLTQQEFWSDIGGMIKNGGSIDILACNVGANVEGLQLIQQIDNLVDNADTGHYISINASTDATGNLSSGGDWTLEVGNVDALDRYFDANKVTDWNGLLDPLTVINVTNRVEPGQTGYVAVYAYQNGVKVYDVNGSAAGSGMTYQFTLPSGSHTVFRTGTDGNAGYLQYHASTSNMANDVISYRVWDGTAYSNTAYVTFVYANDAPVATSTSATMLEGAYSMTGRLSAYDPDTAQNYKLTYSILTQPAQGRVILNNPATGDYTYYPQDPDFNGSVSFTFRVSDGTLSSNIATQTINITPVNDAPVVRSANLTVNEDSTQMYYMGVSDVESSRAELTYSVATPPKHGTVGFVRNSYAGTTTITGEFVYRPNPGYTGSDSFVINVSDGKTSTNGTFNFNVLPVNDAPVAQNSAAVTAEDTSLSGKVVATDVDSANLTYSVVTGPSHGTLTLNPDGTYIYKPSEDYYGTDSFTYRASDGTLFSNNGVVNLTVTSVNDNPTGVNHSYSDPQNTTLNVDASSGLLAGANDVDAGDVLTVSLVTNLTKGAITLNSDGSFSYTPAAGSVGIDSFTYQVVDSQGATSEILTATIDITFVGTAPIANSSSITTPEDTPIAGQVTWTDTDSTNFTVSVVNQPAHGTVVMNTDGSYTYTPGKDFSGTDTFTFKVNDGVLDSATQTVSINVLPVNDAPVVLPSTVTTQEDTPYNGQVVWTDPDSSNFTVSVVNQPQHGAIVMNNDGTYTYTPTRDYTGPDSFSVVVNDGQADSNIQTISITVGPVNDAPVVSSPTFTALEDALLTILPASLGSDSDSPSFTIKIVTPPAHGSLTMNADGSVTYTPDSNYNGADSFRYTLNDGTYDSATVGTATINVTAVNDAPVPKSPTLVVAEDGSLPIGISQLGSDIDGNPLSIIITLQPAHGTLIGQPDGSVIYQPAADFNGTDSFRYRVNDGTTDSVEGVVNIVVTAVNDAPDAISPTIGVLEDVPVSISAAQLGTDVDGDPLTINIVNPPEHGTLQLEADGSIKYTPDANFNGTDSFSYTVNDGSTDSNEGTVNLIVSPVNNVPTTLNPTIGVQEDGVINIAPEALGSDVDGDNLTIQIVTPPEHGTLTLLNNGTVAYIPDENFNGNDSFSYTVSDGITESAPGIAYLVVDAVNDAPVATSPTLVLSEDTALNMNPSDLGSDVDGDLLSIHIVTPPQHGTIIQNDDGSITYQPNSNFNGNDTFSYTVGDGTTESAVGTVMLIVAPVNDAPEVTNPTISLPEGSPITIPLSNLGTDVDGDPLSIIITQPPTHGVLITNPDGSITYVPNTNYSGPDSFSYTVTDGTLTSTEGTAQIVVNPVQGEPFIIPPQDTTGGNGLLTPDGGPSRLDYIELSDPFATNFGGDLSNHNFKFLPADLFTNKESSFKEGNGFGGGSIYQDRGGTEGDNSFKINHEDDGKNTGLGFKAGDNEEADFGTGGWYYQNDDLSKLLFFLGPITHKTDYTARSNLGNLLRTRKKNLFRYREKRKIKKFSDLIEFLGLADLSYKRATKRAIQRENLNTIQRGTLEKNLDPTLFGEEHLKDCIKELKTLSNMEVNVHQFPIMEALAVELLTKYIAAQELSEGTMIPFPVMKVSGHSASAEYTVTGVFTLGTSGIPIYLLTGNNLPPLLIFRGTKLGLRKITEVRSIIENFNSKGPARLHYNNFLPTMQAFFEEWFSNAPLSKKFRIFGYSQGGVLGQRTLIDFPQHFQTSDKYPSIFFNSPGVEEDYYRKWKGFDEKHRPAATNYVTTGDVVSKIGTGFVGDIFEINPKEEKDFLESHYGMKFLEEDWKIYRVDGEAETKSETRAMLNAIQASFLTTEVYKIASAGVEKLYAANDKWFSANKVIHTFEINTRVPEAKPPVGIEKSLLGNAEVLGTEVFSGHVSYINTNDNSTGWTNDLKLNNNFKPQTKKPTKKAKTDLINSITKSALNVEGAKETTAFDHKREAPLQKTESAKPRLLDLSIEPDLYSQADMSAAAIAIIEDLREMMPEADGTEYKVLDAIKEEKKIDHLNL